MHSGTKSSGYINSIYHVLHINFRFHMISYCSNTRRLAVGTKFGQLTMYELRSGKEQVENRFIIFSGLTKEQALYMRSTSSILWDVVVLLSTSRIVSKSFLTYFHLCLSLFTL